MAPSNDLRGTGCLGKPFVLDTPPRYLVVWAGAVHDVLPSDEYDPDAFDLFETVSRISSIYGFEYERVELIVLKISNWCQSAMKWRKSRTLFEFTQFVKGELVPKNLAHDPRLHADTLWMVQVASELLRPSGGFVDDYRWSDLYNEMAYDPDDLAVEWERVWLEVKYAKGEDLLQKCFRESRTLEKVFHSSPTYNSLLCLALCLQRSRGEEPIKSFRKRGWPSF